jgi:hypothetical protein
VRRITGHGECEQGAVPSTKAFAVEMKVTLVAFVPGGTGPPVGALAGDRLLAVADGGANVVVVELRVRGAAAAPLVLTCLEEPHAATAATLTTEIATPPWRAIRKRDAAGEHPASLPSNSHSPPRRAYSSSIATSPAEQA